MRQTPKSRAVSIFPFSQRFFSIFNTNASTFVASFRAEIQANQITGNYSNSPKIAKIYSKIIALLHTPIPNPPPIAWISPIVPHSQQYVAQMIRLIEGAAQFWFLKVKLLQIIVNDASVDVTALLIRELEISFSLDPINIFIRRELIRVPGGNRRLLHRKILDMNKMKVEFQKQSVVLLSQKNELRAVELLFHLYYKGTSRLWRDALDALNRMFSDQTTRRLLELAEDGLAIPDQAQYLKKIFIERDIVPFLVSCPDSRIPFLRDILLEQGPINLNRLAFLIDQSPPAAIRDMIDQILPKLEQKIETKPGLCIML